MSTAITVIKGEKPETPAIDHLYVIAICDHQGRVINSIEVSGADLGTARTFGFVAYKIITELLSGTAASIGSET